MLFYGPYTSVQFRSRWYLCARKSPYTLNPVSSRRFLRRFLNVALWDSFSVRLTDDDSFSSFQEDHRALLSTPLSSTPGDRWCDVFGLVPAVTFPSSSTLGIFREASHSWWLVAFPQSICSVISLHSSTSSSTPTGVFERDCRTLHDSLGLLNRWEWRHVGSL